MEIWKSIPDYEGAYEASDLGNIRSLAREVSCKNGTRISPARILKKQCNDKGYHHVRLSLKGSVKIHTVHQLIALCFMTGFIKGTELNHIDGDKQNNAVSNLEKSNPIHNQLHAVRTGLVPKQGASKFKNVSYAAKRTSKKKWVGSIRHDGKNIGWKAFETEIEAAVYVDSLLDSIGDNERLRNFP